MLIQLVRMTFGAQNLEVANPAWLSGGGAGFRQPDAAVEPYCGARLCTAGAVLHLAHSEQNASGSERAGGDAKPQHGGLLRRPHRTGRYAGVWPRVRHCRVGRRGIVPIGERGTGAGPGIHHRFVPGGWCSAASASWPGVAAAFGLGIFNKILEPQMGAVLGKILILVAIILFIQKRPQGLFALKGRVTD